MPLGLVVRPEPAVMTDPPQADILVIRRDDEFWTEAQRERLPDGIRDSSANHILIEFKATESFNELALQQALGYDYFYRQAQTSLKYDQLQTFVISSMTPQRQTLVSGGFKPSDKLGVYESDSFVFRHIKLILLNELSNEAHNAFIRCFASVEKENHRAFAFLKKMDVSWLKGELLQLINVLYSLKVKGVFLEMTRFTVEEVMQLAEKIDGLLLSDIKVEDVVGRFELTDVLAQYKPEEVLAQYKPEEVLAQFPPIQQTIAETEKEALLRSQRHTLIRLLQRRFGDLSEALIEMIESTTDSGQLDHWLEQILDAQSLADMGFPLS